jgi:hypothetical protein
MANEWEFVMYFDSDWADDLDNRKNITGFILYVMGGPVVWKSNQQGNVSLSSTEAEYVALSEAKKKITFIAQTLESIGIEVNYPIIVQVEQLDCVILMQVIIIYKELYRRWC